MTNANLKTVKLSLLIGLLFTGVTLSGLWDKATIVFQQRIIKMTFEKGDDSGRQELYSQAWRLGLAAPAFGVGLGGFHTVNPIGDYPHNLFLETFAEGGLVGVALLTSFLIGGFRHLPSDRRGDPGVLTWTGFVTLFVACQFSGDIFDSRLLFILPVLGAPVAGQLQRRRT